jgi:hypothetical protein
MPRVDPIILIYDDARSTEHEITYNRTNFGRDGDRTPFS